MMTSPATAASAAIAAAFLQQLQQLQVDAAEAAGILLPAFVGPSDKQIQTMAGGAVFMPWPLHKPEVNVPFFGSAIYKYVNLNAAPSQLPSGIDLPLNDITTLRFFLNLGVQQSRAVLLSQQFALMHNATAHMQSEQQKPLPSSYSAADLNVQRKLIDVHDRHLQQSAHYAALVAGMPNATANKAGGSFSLQQSQLHHPEANMLNDQNCSPPDNSDSQMNQHGSLMLQESRAIMDAIIVMSTYAASGSSSPPCLSTLSIPLDPMPSRRNSLHHTDVLEQTEFLPKASAESLVNPQKIPIVHIFLTHPVSVSSSTSSISTVTFPFTSSRNHLTGRHQKQLVSTRAAAASSTAFPDQPIRQRMRNKTPRKRNDEIRRRVAMASSPFLKPNHFALAAASVAASRRLRLGVAAATDSSTVVTTTELTSPVLISPHGGTPPSIVERREEEDTPALAPLMILSYLISPAVAQLSMRTVRQVVLNRSANAASAPIQAKSGRESSTSETSFH